MAFAVAHDGPPAGMTFTDTDCYRCNGEGIIEAYHHVRGGLCFKCWGVGKLPAPPKPPTQLNASTELLLKQLAHRR